MKVLRYVFVVLLVAVSCRTIAFAQHLAHNIPDFCRGSADTVGSGQTMVISGKVTKGCIRVEDGGRLVIRSNTTLIADMIFGLPGSRLEGGTPAQPLDNVQIIGRNGSLNRASDPEEFGRGLVWFGSVRLDGVPKTSFARLTEEPIAGQGQIFAQTTGWRPGDRLVLPDTTQPEAGDVRFAEIETPQVVVAAPNVVTIQPALRFDHRGARDMEGTLRFMPHVGNLTRSIRIRSENPAGTRWHVIFVDRADVDIRYVSFVNLGRTTTEPLSGSNVIGRYSLHIHHVFGPTSPQPNGRQFTLIGNVVEGGTKWGITVHNSHYGLIQDNVVYNTGGAGIMTEDGSETGNIFEHNFVVAPSGPGGEENNFMLGRESSGLWFRGPHNIVRNNVVANTLSNAVVYVNSSNPAAVHSAVTVPDFPGANPAVNGRPVDNAQVPLAEFSGNEMYASTFGAIFWDVMASCCTDTYEGPTSLIKNTTVWHITKYGAFPYATNRMVFEDWTQLNDARLLSNVHEPGTGFVFGDYLTRYVTLRRVNIQGARVGIWTPVKAGDLRDPFGSSPGIIRVEDSVLRNHTNVHVTMPYGVTGGGVNLPPRRIELHRVLFGDVPADTGPVPQADIFPEYKLDYGPNINAIVSTRILVTDFNRVTGQNFEVFREQQAPSFTVPQSGSFSGLVGAPVGGLSNQQAWGQFGIAVSGAVAPCDATRSRIVGFTCAIRPPAPAPTPAAAAANVAQTVAGVSVLSLLVVFVRSVAARSRHTLARSSRAGH